MKQVTITAKIQIKTSEQDKDLLKETMEAYRKACNYVSKYIFKHQDLKMASVNKAIYHTIRDKFNLKSQMTESAIKTVIARYKAILENQDEWVQPDFRKPQYDLVWNRDYSLNKDKFSVNTLTERIKLAYVDEGMSKYFDHTVYKFGTAKLVYKHDKFFLHIPVTYDVEEGEISDKCNVVGIDRGINFVVTTYNSAGKTGFVSGKTIKQKRANYSNFRKKLQKRNTPSSRRRLKAVGHREHRWMQDVNHCVSKALVTQNPRHTIFVLEDLTGIRGATEHVRLKDRYVSVSWSFYDLETKLKYKAAMRQMTVIKVDPRYTSQKCPICGHTESTNRNKKIHLFTCKECGYKSNDDRIGAMNLYHMGIEYIKEWQERAATNQNTI